MPPRALRPAQLGVVLIGRVTLRHIGATVVDLAERGYLRVELIEDDARDWQITDLDAGPNGLLGSAAGWRGGCSPAGSSPAPAGARSGAPRPARNC